MSQKWEYNGIELEVDLQDANFAEKYEDAGIILGESFKILKDNLGVWENDKQNLLSDKTNLQILKTYPLRL